LRFLDEYRDAELVHKYAAAVKKVTTRPWALMEICGGQTHTIVRYGLDGLLPDSIELIHGPGCPVCVTPIEKLDKAMELAARPEVIFCTFGDMLRVPGSEVDLLTVKARGGRVRTVYGPMDALRIARENPGDEIVFFGVGFETTAPAIALTIHTAREQKVANFSVLVSHVLVPPAIKAILGSPTNRVQGFLAAGHVCTVMGYTEYEPIAKKYKVPIVVTGFEPADILQGVYMCVQQLEAGEARADNQYTRSVRRGGNEGAQEIIRKVFAVTAREWRGIGEIPESGLALRPEYAPLDAEKRFPLSETKAQESPDCISGLILQGVRKPHECAMFGTSCTPERPLGAPMVSSEGACAAYYRYRRFAAPGIM
jgi:hydrogenase expression/formation protein HypD